MTERRFTDLELERKLVGDLSPARAKALESEATPADMARLSELRDESAAYLSALDVDLEVRRIEQRAERLKPPSRRSVWLRWLLPAGALVAAAAALLLAFFNKKEDRIPGDDDDLRTKGDDISLVIHASAGADSTKLATGDTITPGTKLRFEIQGGKQGFIAVVGIDGSNATTIYYPWNGSEAAPLGADRLLPKAIQIDATPGDEKFFAVFSTKPFAVSAILPGLQGTGALPAGVVKSEVVLHKK